jgi:hypothetical protein
MRNKRIGLQRLRATLVEHNDRFADRVDNALRQRAGVCGVGELLSKIGLLHKSGSDSDDYGLSEG